MIIKFFSKAVFYSTISGGKIFNSIWKLFLQIIKDIVNIMTSALSSLMSGFINALNIMFQSWGFSLSSYGIWGPLMVVVSLGIAGIFLYFFFDFIGGEKDVLGGEKDL